MSEERWRRARWAGAWVLVLLAVWGGADAGVIWDEPLQAEYGDRVLRWFSSGFHDRGATDYLDLFLYGGLFEAVAQAVAHRSPIGIYETRHLLTALAAVGGVALVGATAALVRGERAGVCAALALALTPAWVGHGLFNSKDVPFGAMAAAVMWVSVRLATRPAPLVWRETWLANALVGVALAMRPGGIFVLLYPWLGACAACWRAASRARAFARASWRLAVGAPIVWLLMISAWPWAQLSPFARPIDAMRAATQFAWDGEVLFAGRMLRATALPAAYLPTWFALTTPDFYVVALALGPLAAFWARTTRGSRDARSPVRVGGSQTAGVFVVSVCAALPLLAALVARPVLYDGLRHFLFVFPPMAVLAGCSFDAALSRLRASGVATVLVVAAMGVGLGQAVWDMAALHPYEYVYFNRWSGGLAAAAGRYETDYWGASYKEGLAWVDHEVAEGRLPQRLAGGGPLRVSSCNDNSNLRLEYYRQQWPGAQDRLVIAREYRVSDVYLAVTRYDCHKRPGDVLHVVQRQGVPLLYVIRSVPRP